MRYFKSLAAGLSAAALLAACGGGGGNGDQSPKVTYTAAVAFGDSLSDAGTYKVGPVLASGGGIFSINGIAGAVGSDPTPSYTWASLVAAAAVGTPSCAARTGGFGVAISMVANCTNYAQGGSRVTDPKGVGNPVGVGFLAGPLTEPVATQVTNYTTAHAGKFTGTELVTVLAGANDIFGQTDKLKADATTAGGNALATSLVTQLVGRAPAEQQAAAQVAIGTAIGTAAATAGATPQSIIGAAVTAAATHAAMNAYTTTAVADAATIGATAGAAATTAGNTYAATTGAQNAVAGMVAVATDLANQVKGMLTKGATHVVVVNLPVVSRTPYAMATIVYNPDGSIKDNSSQQLVDSMTTHFNDALKAGLTGIAGVLLVDAYAENSRQLDNPATYSLFNVKDVACNLTAPANPFATAGNADGSSLVCNAGNLIAGDTSHYLFADNVHPTPYGHKLLSQLVTKEMLLAGWL